MAPPAGLAPSFPTHAVAPFGGGSRPGGGSEVPGTKDHLRSPACSVVSPNPVWYPGAAGSMLGDAALAGAWHPAPAAMQSAAPSW